MEEKIYHIITHKLSGVSLSEKEESALNKWVSEGKNTTIYNRLVKVWEASGKINYKADVDVNKEWDIFKERLSVKKSKTLVRKYYIAASGLAASIIIVLGLLFVLNNQSNTYQYSANENHFVLPDSSEVWLNKNTTLQLARSFGKKNRTVMLNGEAFFDVQKAHTPFVIETPKGISATVLGTSFNLNSYSNNNAVQLQVITGLVKFGNASKGKLVNVKKGNQAIYFNKSNELQQSKLKNKNKLSWRTGEFDFNNEPMSEVVRLLEKYIGLEIELPVSDRELNYSGKFNNPTAYDVAIIFAKAFGYEYTLTSEKLSFHIKTALK